MVTIRCTKKLLTRWPVTESQDATTTTALGDWYANILFVRPQVILFMNERSLLGVPVIAAPVNDIYPRFIDQMILLLRNIGTPEEKILAEIAEMQKFQVAKTNSRTVLGSLNDMMWHLENGLYDEDHFSLGELAQRLAKIPFKATGYRYPQEVASELFSHFSD